MHASLPLVDGGEGFKVKNVHVLWASPGSGFTLLMEGMMVLLAQGGMTVPEAVRVIGENDHRLWRVHHRHVDQAHQKMDVSTVTQFCVDETSIRRALENVTVFCEATQGEKSTRVLMVAEGKDSGTLGEFRRFLQDREVPSEQIQEICAEMIRVAKTIKKHWDGLVAYIETRLTNGPIEAINGIIQTAKRKARGFKNFEYFQTIIYLIGSKLEFDLPSPILEPLIKRD